MRKLSLLFLMALLSACSTAGTSRISNVEEIKNDAALINTSRDDIVAKYGEPQNKYVQDGQEVYEYKYVKVYNNPASYPPLIGLFFAPNRYSQKYVYFRFDKHNAVVAVDAYEKSGAYPPENILW